MRLTCFTRLKRETTSIACNSTRNSGGDCIGDKIMWVSIVYSRGLRGVSVRGKASGGRATQAGYILIELGSVQEIL